MADAADLKSVGIKPMPVQVRPPAPIKFESLTRGGAMVARRAHNPKVAGSSPVPAPRTKKPCALSTGLF